MAGQKGATSLSVTIRWRSACRHFAFEVHWLHLRSRHRKAQFGARINHSAQVDAEFFGERQELGCSRIAVRYRLMAKLAFVCHRL